MRYLLKSSGSSAILFFLIFISLTSLPCFSQEAIPTVKPIWNDIYNSPEASFEEIRENFREYWKDRPIGKGYGYKPFKRWEAFMAPRIYPSNDMSLVKNTYFNYLEWERKQDLKGGQKSFAGNWTPLGPFTKADGEDTGVGRINMVRFDPNNSSIMYVGAANGGLWKSTDGGTNWSTDTDFLEIIGVSDLAIDANNSQNMYLATGDSEGDRPSIGVLKSTDGGGTWSLKTLPNFSESEGDKISRLLISPTNSSVLLAATTKGVYRSTNSGDTWTAPTTATGEVFKDMVFKPGNTVAATNIVYATSKKLWKSIDNGVTFTELTNGVPSTDVSRMGVAVTPAEPNSVFLIAGKNSNGGLLGIYKSINNGTAFTIRFEPDYGSDLGTDFDNPNILGNEPDGSDAAGQSFYTLAFAVSPTNADFMLVGGVSQWASDDGGLTWYISSYWAPDDDYEFVHADTHEILFSSDGTKAYSSCDGGLSMYVNGTNNEGTWTDLSNNLNISQQEIIGMSATNPNKIAAGLQDIGTVLNTAPDTWKVIGGGDGEYCFIDYENDDIIVETGTNGYHTISKDGGLTEFTEIFVGIPEGEFKSPIHQDPVDSETYYAGGRKYLYYSLNQGEDWERGTNKAFPDEDNSITEFQIAPSDNTIIYATNGFYLAKSEDEGDTWTYLDEPNNDAAITQIAISDIDANKVWITCSGYFAGQKVFKSTDGGENWTNLSTGLPNIPFNTVVFQNGSNDLVYVGADVGVYHRDKDESSWTPFFDDLPRTQIKDLKIFYPTMKLRAATYGRGTWQTDAVESSLPVTLRSFTGVNLDKVNQLNWVTTEETDLAYYEVERSFDGFTYTTIGKVMPLTSGTDERTYDFTDQRPASGINYYRLKMTDLDESHEYSRVVTLFVEDELSDVSVFPNPASHVINLRGLNDATANLRVMDALGRLLIVQTIATTDGLNVSRLPLGTYFVEVSSATQVPVIKRFVKK